MRSLGSTSVAIILTAVLCASVGYAVVPDEIVLWGDENDRPATNAANYNPTTAEIKINANVFFEIRTPAAGYSVAEREAIVLKRIIEVFSRGKISPVYVDSVRGHPTIYVDRIRLVTVYPEDVACYGAISAWALAEKWADGVRKALLLTAPSSCFGGPPTYTVAIGGKVFFRLIDPRGYENVRQRGRAVDRQLALIVSDFAPELVWTMPVHSGIAVTVKGKLVVVATPGDAYPRGMTVQALASAWAGNLRRVMPIVKTGTPAAPPPPPSSAAE